MNHTQENKKTIARKPFIQTYPHGSSGVGWFKGKAEVSGYPTPGISGLYTISEKEEDIQPGNVYKIKYNSKMSGEHQKSQIHQPDTHGSGSLAAGRSSSLQAPDKHPPPYGSVPDVTSSGFKEEMDEDVNPSISNVKDTNSTRESKTPPDSVSETSKNLPTENSKLENISTPLDSLSEFQSNNDANKHEDVMEILEGVLSKLNDKPASYLKDTKELASLESETLSMTSFNDPQPIMSSTPVNSRSDVMENPAGELERIPSLDEGRRPSDFLQYHSCTEFVSKEVSDGIKQTESGGLSVSVINEHQQEWVTGSDEKKQNDTGSDNMPSFEHSDLPQDIESGLVTCQGDQQISAKEASYSEEGILPVEFATGISNVSLSDFPNRPAHKHRPTHGRMKRRASIDAENEDEALGHSDQTKVPSSDEISMSKDSVSSKSHVDEDSFTRNDSSVKFSDTVMVSTFSSAQSDSVISAAKLNDIYDEQFVTAYSVDDEHRSHMDTGVSPAKHMRHAPMSLGRKESAGNVIRPADIIKKKQRIPVEAFLSKEKKSASNSSFHQAEENSQEYGSSEEKSFVTSAVMNYSIVRQEDSHSAASEAVKESHERDSQAETRKKQGYGDVDFTNPAELLRHLQDTDEQETKEDEIALGYATPSQLFRKYEDREVTSGHWKSPGYAELDHTTPSQLFMKQNDREITENNPRSPSFERLDHTTPSELVKKRKRKDSKEVINPTSSELFWKREVCSPDDVEAAYTTPSVLFQQGSKHEETLEHSTPSELWKKCKDREKTSRQPNLPGYDNIDHTTPSQLLEKYTHEHREVSGQPESPGYANLDHTTPSQLLRKYEDRGVICGQPDLPGYANMDHTTPSQLLRKNVDREVTSEHPETPGYANINHTTPSQLLRKYEERGVTNGQSESPGYANLDHATPSQLLRKYEDREETSGQSVSPGYTNIDHTTPSQLLRKYKERGQSELPGYSIIDHTAPSQLLRKYEDREMTSGQPESPGYGDMDHTTPSQLLRKYVDREVTSNHPESPGYANINHTTPSQLFRKQASREITEKNPKSPGYGQLDHTTPSEMLFWKRVDSGLTKFKFQLPARYKKNDSPRTSKCENTDNDFGHSTPSKLLRKYKDREKTSIQSKSPGYTELDHTTPSKLFRIRADREITENKSKSPGYGVKKYTTPSKLFMLRANKEKNWKNNDKLVGSCTKQCENLAENDIVMTPTASKLFQKKADREVTYSKSKSPGYAESVYTTPSRLLKDKEGEKEQVASMESFVLDTTPSKLMQKRKDREESVENRGSPGYEKFLDGTTPSMLFNKIQNRITEDELGQSKYSNGEVENDTDTWEADQTMSDSGVWTLPIPSSLSNDVLRNDLRSMNVADQEDSCSTCVSEKTPKQKERFLNWRTYSDLTTYYVELSDYISRMAQRMKMKSEPDIIGMQHVSSGASTSQSEDQGQSVTSRTPDDSNEEIIKPNQNKEHDTSVGQQSQEHNENLVDLDKLGKHGSQERRFASTQAMSSSFSEASTMIDSAQSDTGQPYLYDTETEYTGDGSKYRESCSDWSFLPETTMPLKDESVWDSHSNLPDKYHNASVSTVYPSSGLSSYTDAQPLALHSTTSWNSGFTTCSSSSSSDEQLTAQEEDYSGSKDTERKFLPENLEIPDSIKSLNDLLWSLYFTNPKARQSMHASLTSLSSRQPSTVFDFCTDNTTASTDASSDTDDKQEKAMSPKGRVKRNPTKPASRLPRPQPRTREVGRYESGPKKRTLPNMRSATPDGRGMLMEKEMMESQNRKLQMEISTLQTENKLLKDKYNRASAKITDLEERLTESKEQLESLQGNLTQELSEVQRKNKSAAVEEMDQFQTRIISLTKENESLKAEVFSLEKQLEFAHKNTDRALLHSEKNKTMDAHKMEITTLKDEVNRVKSLLEQSEHHLQEEELRNKEARQQIIKLTEMKNLLQQQVELGGGGATATDKQIKSLEKRLRVTEERLHQERADRANNLSQVEDKLLTENARLQAVEKELSRQLHREKDKNRNLENKIKDVREDNEKLRLSLPFDEAALTSQKAGYDIPYSVHATQRQETVKADYRHILSQLETEAGLKPGQEKDMICQLWNTRQQTYHQLRQLEITLQALNLRDNNIVEGLKNLRDVKSQADTQLKQLQEKLDDAYTEKSAFETTYKEQLTLLVNERHDAFARLKTAEDLMEAIRSENEILKSSLSGIGTASLGASATFTKDGRVEALQAQVKELEGQILQMTRTTRLLEGELSTVKVQLEARDKSLEDVQSELQLAHSRLAGDGGEDRKQEKIDKLTSQINGHQTEIRLLGDKVTSLNTEKSRLERELEAALREVNVVKAKVRESKHGEMADSKQAHMLREALEERDMRLSKLTQEYDTVESELQQARQDLYAEQIQSQDYEAQIESYQQQVEQRGQILETLSGTEKEQMAQFQILKETLDSVSQELNQKCAELKVSQLEMSKEKDKLEYMEKELASLKRDKPSADEDKLAEISLPSHLLQIRELETERDQLKTELIQVTESLRQATEDHGNLEKTIKQLQQELVDEKSAHLQTNAERGELEQHLEEIAEEHDALSQERDQSEEDIVKLENNLKDVIHKYEMETRKNHENLASKYPNVPPEALKMAGELDSLRSLSDAKKAEHEMLTDKINRQQVEMDFLNRRVELLHNENQCNREDIARLTSEVSAKIKEGVANREINQFLVTERAKLQKENAQLVKDMEKEKGIKERRRAEIADVMRKVEKSEESTKSSSREVLQKEAVIASLDSELGETKNSLKQLETEKIQLLSQVEHLQKDLETRTTLASSLEGKLDIERERLEEEKTEVLQKKDELMSACHELDRLKHDHGLLLNNLNDEKQTVENLKESLHSQQQSCEQLTDKIKTLTMELETTQAELMSSRDTVEGLKQDKGAIYQEYDTMIRRLSEKDQKIAELQNKCDKTEEQMQKELTLQKHNLERERTSAERDLEHTKDEIIALKDEVKQKEVQLSTFGRTLKELEDVTKEKMVLENQVKQMESTMGDSGLLTESLRKETMTLQETIARQQESLGKLQTEHTALSDKMRIQEEKLTDQIIVLEKTNSDLRNQYDGEKSYLKDSLAQTQNRVASVESSLASAIDARDKLQVNCRMLERSLEETKERLQEETTSCRVAQQRAESLQSQLQDARKDRYLTEEKLNKTMTALSKTEKDFKSEKEQTKRLSEQQQELEATVYTKDSSVKTKQEQIDLLQEYGVPEEVITQQPALSMSEISKLRQILESQKQQLNSKLKKTTTEMKQQIEIIEEDRSKLIQQNQLLSTDVEKARDQLAMKNKENLRLQETILGQEDQLREHTLRLRRAEDARKAEEELQSKLSSKFVAQEEELKRMKIYLSKKAEEAGENEKSTWMDLNRLIQDMNRQLHEHMKSQKSGDQDSKDRELLKYRKRVIDLESELSTEKAVHNITRSSLQALEEDNQRLRHQYHAMRRRDNVTGDKKYKSRMEAINEIIAKSQTQAQAMLAASGYYDDPMKSFGSPRLDYKGSPDNSMASDLSFNSTGPMVIPPYIPTSSPTKATVSGPAGQLSPRK